VPLLLICGKKEAEDESVTIRQLGSEQQETLPLDQAIQKIYQKNKLPIN
jgi:threonyl-tRNA synthetase